MPQTSVLPGAGSTSVAAGQVTARFNLVLEVSRFGQQSFEDDIKRRTINTYVSGLPRIFISLMQYPSFNRGDFTFDARPWIAWRVVGTAAGDRQPGFPLLAAEDFIAVTTPQLLPVGQPVNITLVGGGLESVSVEFDTTAGIPAINQGFDRVVLTITASQ